MICKVFKFDLCTEPDKGENCFSSPPLNNIIIGEMTIRPDGKFFAVYNNRAKEQENQIEVWDVEKNCMVKKFKTPQKSDRVARLLSTSIAGCWALTFVSVYSVGTGPQKVLCFFLGASADNY